MNIISTLEKSGYEASEPQVEALAREVVHGTSADGTYLRVLVVAAQASLGPAKRKLRAPRQRAAVDKAHKRLYPAVVRGVKTLEASQREVQRRATFARTAASTLRSFAERGGDLRGLVVAEVTKAKLRRAGEPVPTGTKLERAMHSSFDATKRAIARMQRKDPKTARRELTAAIDALQAMLDAVNVPAPTRASRRVTTAEVRAH